MNMKIKTIIAALALCAAGNGNAHIVQMLLKAGADVNADNDYYDTALLWATNTKAPSAEVVKLLLEAGADVNAMNEYGYTAHRYAEERDAADVIALLKSAGAKTEE